MSERKTNELAARWEEDAKNTIMLCAHSRQDPSRQEHNATCKLAATHHTPEAKATSGRLEFQSLPVSNARAKPPVSTCMHQAPSVEKRA